MVGFLNFFSLRVTIFKKDISEQIWGKKIKIAVFRKSIFFEKSYS
jgi:hypothetical protein